MKEDEFVLTQERLHNIEARFVSMETDIAEFMAENPKSNDQWVEKRIRVLEDKVRWLLECFGKSGKLYNGKRTKADHEGGAEDQS